MIAIAFIYLTTLTASVGIAVDYLYGPALERFWAHRNRA
jgi:hypothetical protein